MSKPFLPVGTLIINTAGEGMVVTHSDARSVEYSGRGVSGVVQAVDFHHFFKIVEPAKRQTRPRHKREPVKVWGVFYADAHNHYYLDEIWFDRRAAGRSAKRKSLASNGSFVVQEYTTQDGPKL